MSSQNTKSPKGNIFKAKIQELKRQLCKISNILESRINQNKSFLKYFGRKHETTQIN